MRAPVLVVALAGVWLVADPFQPMMWAVAAPLAITLLAFADSGRSTLVAPFVAMAVAMTVQVPLAYVQGANTMVVLLFARLAFLLYVPAIAVAGYMGRRIRLKHQAAPPASASPS